MEDFMYCERCKKPVGRLDHHFIPVKGQKGYRLCLECAKKEKIITLV